MSRATILQRGRAAAEAGMTDACVIRRRTGQTTDDLTGATVYAYATVYTGPCRIQQRVDGQRVEAGEATNVVLRRELQLPVESSTGVRHGDEATITACVNDAALVNRVFVLRDEHGKSEATARRMTCEEPT